MSYNDLSKGKSTSGHSIMDDMEPVKRSVSAAALRAARTGQPQKLLKVYNYCNPQTARKMVDFSPHMAAYLPCRISIVEQADGLWIAPPRWFASRTTSEVTRATSSASSPAMSPTRTSFGRPERPPVLARLDLVA